MGNARFAAVLAVLVSVGVAAWPGATQKSVAQGVTVAVTPGTLDPRASVWDFAVAFEGRGRKLDDEVMENFVLVGDGHRIKPLAWEGEKPAMGHRAGVLKFVAIRPRPRELELQLVRPGEARPRVFRFWSGGWTA